MSGAPSTALGPVSGGTLCLSFNPDSYPAQSQTSWANAAGHTREATIFQSDADPMVSILQEAEFTSNLFLPEGTYKVKHILLPQTNTSCLEIRQQEQCCLIKASDSTRQASAHFTLINPGEEASCYGLDVGTEMTVVVNERKATIIKTHMEGVVTTKFHVIKAKGTENGRLLQFGG
jgi:hypothetical protein